MVESDRDSQSQGEDRPEGESAPKEHIRAYRPIYCVPDEEISALDKAIAADPEACGASCIRTRGVEVIIRQPNAFKPGFLIMITNGTGEGVIYYTPDVQGVVQPLIDKLDREE